MSDLRERYDFLFDDSGDLTQETLLLYVFGPLENGARDAVEQHVEQCEMCRDAAEGIALLGTKEQALAALAMADERLLERVEQLKQKVTSSGRETLINQSAASDRVVLKTERPVRHIGWYRYAAAASVLLIIGVSFWYVNVNLNKELSPLSMNQPDSTVMINEQKGLELEKAKGSEEVNAESVTIGDTVSVTANGGTTGYSYQWTNGAKNDEKPSPFATGTVAGTYSVTITDDNCCDTLARERVVGEIVAMEDKNIDSEAPAADEVDELTSTMAGNLAPAPTSSPSDDAKKMYEQEEWEKTATRTASSKDEPVLSKGTGNTNFSTNNVSNMADIDVSIYQAQYPGGSVEVQKYFDKVVYPKDLAKGYKGIMVFEVSFDSTGKITNATLISGLGAPYDKLMLDQLKKMPNWTPPSPEGEPIESIRMVTVEVTVK